MTAANDNIGFWNRYARLYDFEIHPANGSAYRQMYRLMSYVLTKDMDVLEVATGTGLIAIHISEFVNSVEATDYAPKMIAAARRKLLPDNVHLAVEDATALSYFDETFDAAIISNALHIMPDPEAALKSIRRVLKPGGLLVAPTYAHGLVDDRSWNFSASFLKRLGFQTYSRWTPNTYADFISQQEFTVQKQVVLKAAFPLVYLEARKAGDE